MIIFSCDDFFLCFSLSVHASNIYIHFLAESPAVLNKSRHYESKTNFSFTCVALLFPHLFLF